MSLGDFDGLILMDEDYEGEDLLINIGLQREDMAPVEPLAEHIDMGEANPVISSHDAQEKDIFSLSLDRYNPMALMST